MALYGGGEPVKSVAYQLGISEETAKSYLKRIREKYRVAGIDVGTKVALRKRAIQDGILIQDARRARSERIGIRAHTAQIAARDVEQVARGQRHKHVDVQREQLP
jgi:hypothetical protein